MKQIRRVHDRHPPVQRSEVRVRGAQHVARDERRAVQFLAVPEQLEAELHQVRAQVHREQPRVRHARVRELPDVLPEAEARVGRYCVGLVALKDVVSLAFSLVGLLHIHRVILTVL